MLLERGGGLLEFGWGLFRIGGGHTLTLTCLSGLFSWDDSTWVLNRLLERVSSRYLAREELSKLF